VVKTTTLLVLASLALLCLPPGVHAQGSNPSTTPPTPIPTATATPTPVVTSPTITPTPTAPTTPPAPTLTMAEAVQQAQGQLPPPPPIYDLTDPGIVYGTLAAGVQAWIATLGGNRDAFGNLVTGTYAGAVRPDVVPASLQTFLLQYYNGDPNIGLAFGWLTDGGLGSIALDASLALGETDGKIHIISAPKVLTVNGGEALISRGNVAYKEIRTQDTIDVKEMTAALSLTVKPTISKQSRLAESIS